jgi:hypothetical protein
METGSEGAIRASRVLFDLDYRLMVSDQPGVLKLQKDCIDEALIQNKDVLFVPATETSQFM